MRRKFFALSDGETCRSCVFKMQVQELSIFVDESGNLSSQNDSSRFFLLCLLLHNQSVSISDLVRKFDAELDRIGLTNLCFHAGPIIRHEDGYEYMNWQLRNRIFSLMMAFARKADFRFRCVCVDKKFVSSQQQLLLQLKDGVNSFLDCLPEAQKTKIYYDCGQAPITNLLHEVAASNLGASCEFVQGVKPGNYKLFQVADLICTVFLIARKIEAGLPLTKSEDKFFGGLRRFKRNVLRPLLSKTM